jgi:hypothetical protein
MADDLPDAPWTTAPKAEALPDAPWATPKPAAAQPSGFLDTVKEGAKGLARGAGNFVGDMGEAVMGPFGPSHHAANLMSDLGFGERQKPDAPYGQQIARAAGIDANPNAATPGKYAGSMGEVVGNPASYFGPGGWLAKTLMAAASGAGSEAAGQAAEGTGWEGPARVAGALAAGPVAARAMKPQLASAQQTLADAGVTQMTPGQLSGGMLKSVEDKLTSFPILGDFIQNARGRSIESFNRAVGNQALEPIGQKLGPRTEAGHEMVAEVERKLSGAYDKLLPKMLFVPDRPFAYDISSIMHAAESDLPRDAYAHFQRILNNKLTPDRWTQQVTMPPAPPPGTNTLMPQPQTLFTLQGDKFKQIESELTHLARRYGSSADAGQQLLGERLGDVVKAMRSNLERSNPAFAGELSDINRGWAMYARIRDAAAARRISEGVFLPSDLLGAVKRGDKSAGKGSFAKGDALMQDFAEAGQHVLPSKVPDSGTAGRTLTNVIAGGGAAYLSPKILAGVSAASVPYMTPSMWLLHHYAKPTTGARAAYSDAGRGFGMIRPALAAPYGSAGADNPYAP